MISSFRTGDFQNTGQALSAHWYIQSDKEYQQRRKEASLQEHIFMEMDPPKEIVEQVDNITSAIHNYWSRYSDLIYQTALSDILTFITDN